MNVNYGTGPVVAEETISAPLTFLYYDFCRNQEDHLIDQIYMV